MEEVKLPPGLRDSFLSGGERKLVVDHHHNVIGEFRRFIDFNELDWLSDAELERLKGQPTHTPEEVMERLRKLTKCE